ncbi:MAG: energy transducer TonB, partial [Pyrinomonadaceae bacterium]|nr:energy transducer TonB [Pyrinomonadaceae bacterium]
SSPSSLVKPEYPKAAIAVRAKGKVEVQVTINELGYVIFAKAVSGHPLLQNAAIDAAKKTKFGMTFLQGIPVKVSGIVVYNFG